MHVACATGIEFQPSIGTAKDSHRRPPTFESKDLQRRRCSDIKDVWIRVVESRPWRWTDGRKSGDVVSLERLRDGLHATLQIEIVLRGIVQGRSTSMASIGTKVDVHDVNLIHSYHGTFAAVFHPNER